MEFENGKILKSNKIKDMIQFQKEGKLLDFIRTLRHTGGIKHVMSWCQDFQDRNIPYVLTKDKYSIILWKEEIVPM